MTRFLVLSALFFSSFGAIAQQAINKPVLPTAEESRPTRTSGPDAPPAMTQPVDESTYIISPEDQLQVTVWKEPGVTGPIPVRPDGMITLALVGDMKGAGYTPMQLSTEIATRLKKFIQAPNVTVSVLAVHPKQIFLLGEVQHVGPVVLTPEMTPLQAISAGGGLTPFANAKHVYILRKENGKDRKIPFNYKSAIQNGNSQGVSLMAGDTIVVP